MVALSRFSPAAVLLLLVSCRPATDSHVDPVLASYIPPGTLVLAGLDLESIRASPAYPNLPPAASSLIQPLSEASHALLAYGPQGLLLVAQGRFSAPPAGATLDENGIALAGSPELIQAAKRQHEQGIAGAGDLLSQANAISTGSPLWLVIQGRAALPLSGNAANLNRFLHMTQYTTATAAFPSDVKLRITATCPNPGNASQFEQSLRALVSLSAARSTKSKLLDSVQIQRDQSTVTVDLTASPAELARLF
jgi:hypothetical protein